MRECPECRTAIDGHPVGEDKLTGELHVCACIDALIKRRRERNAAKEASRDTATTIMQATLNETQEGNRHLRSLLQSMIDKGMVAAPAAAATTAPSDKGRR